MVLSALCCGRRVASPLDRAAASANASPTEKHPVCLAGLSKPSPGWEREDGDGLWEPLPFGALPQPGWRGGGGWLREDEGACSKRFPSSHRQRAARISLPALLIDCFQVPA